MKILKKISYGIDKVCAALVVVMISIMLLATSAQIIWRVGSGVISWMRPLSWSEELTRFLLVWSTFIGATCAYRHGSNIAITAVQGLLPESGQKAAHVLVHVICMVVFVAVFIYGFQFCQRQVRTTDALPVNLPMKVIYSCIPISMVILAFHALVMVLEEITGDKEAV
ncbi:MAG: TRAP transporter small permease [Clostridiales bacterium]|nr:TRAP transporter small permease [Clostridiales bacterium]